MRIRNAISAAAVVAVTAVGIVAAAGTPGYAAERVSPFKKCTEFERGGFKGAVCVDRVGLGEQVFIGTANIDSYPADCAKFRIDLVDADRPRARSIDNIPCATGRIGGVSYPAGATVHGRAFARLLSFDSAGNTILSIDSVVLGAPI